MTAPALAQGVGESRSGTPTTLVRWLIVGGACAAAAASVELALASDRLAERELQVVLLNWVALPYIVAGVIAWSRRRESAFGPLMITVGVVMFISSLQWANATAPYTVGLAYDVAVCRWRSHRTQHPSAVAFRRTGDASSYRRR